MSEQTTKPIWTGPHPRMRDEELLWWLSRFKFIPIDVLCEVAMIGSTRLRRRLMSLRKAGLVEIFEHVREPNAAYLTQAGYRKIGLPPRRPVSFHGAHYEKERAAVLYAVRRERNLESYERLYSQREMRAIQQDTGEELGVKISRPVGEHWPVLSVIGGEGYYTYVEMLFGLKHFGDLQRILRGYRRTGQVGKVLYFVSTAQIARQVKRAGEKVGCRRLEIKPWIELAEPEVRAIDAAVDRGRSSQLRQSPDAAPFVGLSAESNEHRYRQPESQPLYTPPIPPPLPDERFYE